MIDKSTCTSNNPEKTPEIMDFLELLNSTEFNITATSEIKPDRLLFTSTANENDYFYVDLQ